MVAKNSGRAPIPSSLMGGEMGPPTAAAPPAEDPPPTATTASSPLGPASVFRTVSPTLSVSSEKPLLAFRRASSSSGLLPVSAPVERLAKEATTALERPEEASTEDQPHGDAGGRAVSIAEWLQIALIALWIFGGCCSNVFTLEGIIKIHPGSGLIITLSQFLLVAATGYFSHFSAAHPPLFLRPNAVPLRRWVVNLALFFTINVLNNYAFGFNISVPVHIILRSGGSATTMMVGWLLGKRYTATQGRASSATSTSTSTFLAGLAILFFAQVLSALMGLYIQVTYERYGTHWQENLFYSHFLSLPLFLPFTSSITTQLRALASSPPLTPLPTLLPTISLPSQLALLGSNAITQYACIRGVNLLGARSSALTVTVVLNVRKLASLLLSIWLFGNRLAPGVLVGAGVTFASGALYAWEGHSRREREARARKKKTL
ncbi:MAG: golgi uridine diphosphate-N- acetylglucosamine transporter [Thelocarpon impressellum]|nr:MAG: golgi uridine diphosphate-N- acetylglucosamine transporter [Thelocarpon impressellum]